MKCNTCNKDYTADCNYWQGRCPMHPPMLTNYHFRFYNLIQTIKGIFKRGNST